MHGADCARRSAGSRAQQQQPPAKTDHHTTTAPPAPAVSSPSTPQQRPPTCAVVEGCLCSDAVLDELTAGGQQRLRGAHPVVALAHLLHAPVQHGCRQGRAADRGGGSGGSGEDMSGRVHESVLVQQHCLTGSLPASPAGRTAATVAPAQPRAAACAVPVSGRVVVRSTVTAEDSGLAGSATITVTSSSRLSPSLYSCRGGRTGQAGQAGGEEAGRIRQAAHHSSSWRHQFCPLHKPHPLANPCCGKYALNSHPPCAS